MVPHHDLGNWIANGTFTLEAWCGSMPHEQEKRQAPSEERRNELTEADTLLQDPAQIAPGDTQNFGQRLSEIVMQALRRKRRKMPR
jgi:hypothetical protein